ncbi:hypothetical protein [Mesorhizobium sp. L2C066B000]|uniref:hypothetical protein n=1 Tax=Mesorhizobium sp. L2C066B000 TaxID=1287105 RepID=UPI0003CFE703|nr:hypothetical protein [Mesorhizobium sp. L2C066B000]ESZ35060.1 hypothetical protein X732_25735 [Mesorhizobium sp. L2C066B000]
MNVRQAGVEGTILFGVGSYSAQEAALLIKTSARNVNRWLKGYTYRRNDVVHDIEPLWQSQVPNGDDEHLEIGFRDLIELRFVKAFTQAGVGLLAIRNCIEYARECVGDDRPFSTRRFQTDGRTIFLESIERTGKSEVLDLRKKQYVFRQVIDQTFKDLDIENDAVARWRPYRGRPSIVIDPERSFGQPIAAKSGVPTVALADAAEAEGSVERVARLYEVSAAVVRDAVNFQHDLKAA